MSDGLFQCPECGNSLNWFDRAVGQRLRCRCGTTLTVPPEPGRPGIVAARSPAATAAASVGTGLSAYRHLLWPAIIAGAGLILTIVYYAVAMPFSFPTAMLLMVVRVVIDLVLLFAGCMIAMRLLDMALGQPADAVVKLVGVALLPAAIEGLIGHWLPGGFILGWALSLGMYGALLMWFFELNGKEVVTLTTIVWLVQSWAGLVISAVLMQNVLGARLPTSGPVGWMLGQGTESQTPSDQANGSAADSLNRPDAAEGVSWLMTGSLRSVRGRSHQQSEHLIASFYNAHSPAVHVSNITAYPDRREIAAEIVVQLPPDLPDREKVISLARGAGMADPVSAEQSDLLIRLPADTP